MVLGAFSCSGWRFDCWNEFWSIHLSAVLPWSFSWHYLFCSPIPHEEISSCSISYNCHGTIFVFSPWKLSFTFVRPKFYPLGRETNFDSRIKNFWLKSLLILDNSWWWFKDICLWICPIMHVHKMEGKYSYRWILLHHYLLLLHFLTLFPLSKPKIRSKHV